MNRKNMITGISIALFLMGHIFLQSFDTVSAKGVYLSIATLLFFIISVSLLLFGHKKLEIKKRLARLNVLLFVLILYYAIELIHHLPDLNDIVFLKAIPILGFVISILLIKRDLKRNIE